MSQTLGSQVNIPKTTEEIAAQSFKAAVDPLRKSFKDRLGATTESLAQKGIQFGGVGQQRLGDIFREQQDVEANIASSIGSQLAQTAQQQAFQTSEQAKAREFAAEQAGLQRGFTAEQAGLQREFTGEQAGFQRDFAAEQALLGRELTKEEAQLQRDFQDAFLQKQQEFTSTQQEMQNQEARNDQLIQLIQSGNIENKDQAIQAIEDIFGEGIALTPDDEVQLQQIAAASGLSVEDYTRVREAIGQGQLAAILRDPSEFIVDPQKSRDFQLELARIESDAQIKAAEAQTSGSKMGAATPIFGLAAGGKVLCTELHRQGLLDRNVFKADLEYSKRIDHNVVVGYHFWGIPLAKLMKKSKLVTFILKPVIKSWAYHMAYMMGVEEHDRKLGKLLELIMVPICGFIGNLIIKRSEKCQNLQAV